MNKKIVLIGVLIILFFTAVPVFAGVSVDIGASLLGNAYYAATRPLGGTVGIGFTLFDYRAMVQLEGTIMSPPLTGDYTDPDAVFGAGVLFSPVQYFYAGIRTNAIIPPDDTDDMVSVGSLVFRVQNPGKGMHFYAEADISPMGAFNKFTAGLNMTF